MGFIFSSVHFAFIYYLPPWRLIEETTFRGFEAHNCIINSKIEKEPERLIGSKVRPWPNGYTVLGFSIPSA